MNRDKTKEREGGLVLTFAKWHKATLGPGASEHLGQPFFTITRAGAGIVNKRAVAEFGLQETKSVGLFFDAVNNRVGMTFSESEVESEQRFTLAGPKKSFGQFSMGAFARAHRIRRAQYRLPLEQIDYDGQTMFVCEVELEAVS